MTIPTINQIMKWNEQQITKRIGFVNPFTNRKISKDGKTFKVVKNIMSEENYKIFQNFQLLPDELMHEIIIKIENPLQAFSFAISSFPKNIQRINEVMKLWKQHNYESYQSRRKLSDDTEKKKHFLKIKAIEEQIIYNGYNTLSSLDKLTYCIWKIDTCLLMRISPYHP